MNREIIERVKALNPTICIRKAEKGDASIFVDLFNTYYKRKTNEAYFHWQFFDSPFPSALYMAFEGYKLIGYYGIKIYPLTNNTTAGFAIDFLIDELFRKKGLAFLLDEDITNFCIENNASCVTALPNSFGNAAFKALGFKSIAKVDTLTLDTSLTYNKDVEGILKKSENVTQVAFKKDKTSRAWRFNLNPLYTYKTVTVNDNCFAVTKLFTDPVSKETFGDIVDIQIDNLNGAISLIKEVIAKMTLQNVKTVTIWALPHTQLSKNLIKLGFKAQAQERYFCLKVLAPDAESLNNSQLWNLVEADAEIF